MTNDPVRQTGSRSGRPLGGGPGRPFLIGFLILMGLALLLGTLTVLFP